jgi:integrase
VPRLLTAVGTWGAINFASTPQGLVRARTRVRDNDGQIRQVARLGKSKAEAERRLREALRDRTEPHTGKKIAPGMTVAALAERWLAGLEGVTPGTVRLYGIAVNNYVVPGMGAVRLRECDVQAVDRLLLSVRANHGPAAAKAARSVLSGMLGLAVRYGALPANPVREATPISVPRKAARALTRGEVEQLTDALRSSQRAVDLDLPDLVEFMLATGCRIGEACAVRESRVDWAAGTVTVDATVTRVPKVGLVLSPPKSEAGNRTLVLPPYCVAMLARRREELRVRGPEGVVFPSPNGKLRDPSNTQADMREVFAVVGFGWLTSHVFRKTAATMLDEAGLSALEIANQLGHRNVSMTLDVYLGRGVATTRAAEALER